MLFHIHIYEHNIILIQYRNESESLHDESAGTSTGTHQSQGGTTKSRSTKKQSVEEALTEYFTVNTSKMSQTDSTASTENAELQTFFHTAYLTAAKLPAFSQIQF